MEPSQKFAAVGIFLITGAATLVGLSLWLQKSFAERDKACYIMRFDNSVAGLSQGSSITFRGVGVGQVQEIRINPYNDKQIVVRAALDKRTPIRNTTIARLKPQGITGASYVELDFDEKATVSGQPSRMEGCRLIATVPSGIDQIVNRLPQILDSALIVTQRLEHLLDENNVDNISGTLANLNNLTSELNKTGSVLGPQLEKAAAQLNSAMANINSLSDSFNNNGTTATSLQDTLRQAQSTLSEMKDLAEGLRADPQRVLLAPTVNEVKVR